MISFVIFLIVLLLVVGVLIWCVDLVAASIPVPPVIVAVAKVLIILIALLSLVEHSGLLGGSFYRW